MNRAALPEFFALVDIGEMHFDRRHTNSGHGVADCDIFDTGDGGVSLSGGDRQTLTPGGHIVENCHFQKQGRWSKCYVPAVHMVGRAAARQCLPRWRGAR